MSQDHAAGASAARNKLASFLRQHGFHVETSRYGCPPTNEDCLASILDTLEGPSRDGRLAMVVFRWAQSIYTVRVRRSDIEKLYSEPEARHFLFSAVTDRPGRYRHNFLLGANELGDVVVHHERRWRKTWGIEDTTILYFDE